MDGVSFIVPAYNEAARIRACLRSIANEIAWSGIPAEIIVVDNGSTDDTASIAKACGARVVSEPRKGVTRARQAGHRAARYALEACIDADNALPFGWLLTALANFDDKAVVAVSGPVVYHDLPLIVRRLSLLFYFMARGAHRWFAPMIQGGNYLIRGTTLDAMGGYDPGIAFYGEDTDTAKRAAVFGRVVFAPGMWVYSSGRRLAAEGVVRTTWRYVLNYVWVTLFGRPATRLYGDIRQ